MEPTVIRDPPIPHVGPIDGNFTAGKMIRVQGSTFPHSQRFNINLQCGPNIMPRDDVALHISVRIPEHYIARNSLEDGQWGTEQSEGSNPIGPGHQFEILILCDSNKYKIAVNGQHFAEFPQRLPVRRVNHISIDGDVNIALISVEGGIPISGGDGDEEHARGFTPAPAHGPPPAAAQGSPMGPPPGAYGPPSGGYRPPPGAYGPPPGAYGPPPGAYGPPQHGYGSPGGPPAPPGHQAGQQDSGVSDFLGSAGSFLSSALSKGGLLESLTGGNKPPQQPQYQQQPAQPNFFGGGYPGHGGPGGQQQSQFGGLGQIGSMLASQLANNILNPQPKKPVHY